MLSVISQHFKGNYLCNNKVMTDSEIKEYLNTLSPDDSISIGLCGQRSDLIGEGAPSSIHMVGDNTIYQITVKSYMTKPATASFDFMLKYNNNIPMPSTVMRGRKLSQTKGMLEMDLFNDSGVHWHGYVIKSAIIVETIVS